MREGRTYGRFSRITYSCKEAPWKVFIGSANPYSRELPLSYVYYASLASLASSRARPVVIFSSDPPAREIIGVSDDKTFAGCSSMTADGQASRRRPTMVLELP